MLITKDIIKKATADLAQDGTKPPSEEMRRVTDVLYEHAPLIAHEIATTLFGEDYTPMMLVDVSNALRCGLEDFYARYPEK